MSVSAPFEKLTGKRVGSYRLEQLLETHQWGPVFLASNQGGNRYLVRFIGAPPVEGQGNTFTSAEQQALPSHLQGEVHQLASLSHPQLVPLLDYGTYQDVLYLVYPSLDATHLRSRLVPNAFPDLLQIGRFLEQMASALEYAHAHGVLHLNLSTGCIFLLDGEQIAIGELGLLQVWELNFLAVPRTSDRIPHYKGSTESCAPEQLLRQPVDTSTDVYAMGAVLYRMLTGSAPFTGKTRNEILQQHLFASVPSLKTRRDGLPLELDDLIARALAKESAQRIPHPHALAEAYHHVVASKGRRPSSLPAKPGFSQNLSTPSQKVSASSQGPDADHQVQGTDAQKARSVSRRRFVTIASVGTGMVVVASAGIIGSRLLNAQAGSSSPATSAATGNTSTTAQNGSMSTPVLPGNVVAKVADVPANTAMKFPLPDQQNPGILIHLPNDQFVAFDSTCTHESCAVNYNAQDHLLICPCHDAIFDPAKNGAVIQGPATKPLATLTVSVQSDGTITRNA